jgi:predicted transcriptional regulator
MTTIQDLKNQLQLVSSKLDKICALDDYKSHPHLNQTIDQFVDIQRQIDAQQAVQKDLDRVLSLVSKKRAMFDKLMNDEYTSDSRDDRLWADYMNSYNIFNMAQTALNILKDGDKK